MSRTRHGRVTGALLALTAAALWSGTGDAQEPARERARRHMDALVAAYPDFLAGHEGNDIVWRDGARTPFDDGTGEKSFDARLEAPDLEDMFYAPYPPGRSGLPPAFQSDPGRVRFQPLFARMYGDCTKGEVSSNLVDVVWLRSRGGQILKATRINGVAQKLQAISDELDKLPAEFMPYLIPSAGTVNCRTVAGTTRISAHGMGIAIDIAVARADYWRWTRPDAGGTYAHRNRIPWEIVEVFERHGFIWGGKWYHYDTMHFEYRPEIVAGAR